MELVFFFNMFYFSKDCFGNSSQPLVEASVFFICRLVEPKVPGFILSSLPFLCFSYDEMRHILLKHDLLSSSSFGVSQEGNVQW